MKTLAVFCSSSNDIDQRYFIEAQKLGKTMALKGHNLVYGGSDIGLMGAVSRSVKKHGGKTIGISPESLNLNDVVSEIDDELIITESMSERKSMMASHADAFIGLPGGFGTFEEMFEVMTLKQLGEHEKPIIFLNIMGYFDRLLEMFEHIYEQGFAKKEYRQLYHVSESVESAFQYLQNYQPPKLNKHWFI